MANGTGNGIHLDEETRNQEIVASLRGFLKHQTERVSLYKEFNDAFKEYIAKRMTPEEYATICNIVTQGFVELSIEILALEAHLGGPEHSINVSGTSTETSASDSTSPTSTITNGENTRGKLSLNSPEHAQLIRQVQLLEKQKLALTVQGQKLALEKEAQETQDLKDQEAELQADRIVGTTDVESDVQENEMNGIESEGQEINAESTQAQSQLNGGIKLSEEEWQVKLYENRDRLNEVVEEINDKLADIQEAIAVLVL
ncbi:hypothetical protein BGX20_006635 [Mortierella sp. AD010]|nr:hypothetical protein BGX20_006635 [Mortierella sp. AD010]